MSAVRFGRAQKAVALVPLALLSAAWTASLASTGAITSADEDGALPDGTSVPSSAIEDPASYSAPGSIGLGVPSGSGDQIVQTASTNGIPSAALAAYQRAETVINSADEACRIPWELIAAIGRVESNHGRYGGNALDKDGVARPGIFGIALNGSNNTAEITDTDAGQFDNDTVYDRAVGPMQFIPSTWTVVGVDADGDAKRNPQDIDDAALAAAVYLCSGNDDLSTDAGQRTAVYRYNHSNEYVDLVLSVMAAYMQGDYTAVPNSTTSAVYFAPDYNYTSPSAKGTKVKGGKGSTTGGSPSGSPSQPPASTPPTGNPDPTDPTTPPITGGGDDDPVKTIEDTVKGIQETVKKPVDTVTNTVTQTLTLAQATLKCTAEGYTLLTTPTAWNACIAKYTGK